ncbi:MAG: sodium:calcium antiporter [Dehalococcoidia bacterium]|nr:MAG: sodium:calcium antiporter [Dehalococcoidia bacterium]
MVWFAFVFCLIIILFAGFKLTRYGDAIAEKTGLGCVWIGLVLIALVTSLPELVTGISAATLVDAPDLALGTIFGSCTFNLAILAVLDILSSKGPVLNKVSRGHMISAGAGGVLVLLAAASIFFGENLLGFSLGWLGVSSILLLGIYILSVRQIFNYECRREGSRNQQPAILKYDGISNRHVYTRFTMAALAIIGAGIWLAYIGEEIAIIYNLNNSFVGTLFLALTTSMPELAVGIAAVRLGAIDIAVADLMGANMINIAKIFFIDIFYTKGPILSLVSRAHLITAMITIGMTAVVVIGLRFHYKRKILKIAGWYSYLLIGLWLLGAYLIYSSGSA